MVAIRTTFVAETSLLLSAIVRFESEAQWVQTNGLCHQANHPVPLSGFDTTGIRRRCMMKSVICVLLIFFTATTSFPQSGWISQPSGVTSGLNGISFTDSRTGTAVGNADVILRTTDGGSTWARQSIADSYGTGDLHAVSFSNNNTGIAVGTVFSTAPGYPTYLGTWSMTTNGGSNWSFGGGGMGILDGIFCISANVKIFVGNRGVIGRTTDGGSSWYAVYPYVTTANLKGITFADVNKGTVVGDSGTIFRTTDGGTTWIRQLSGTSNALKGVSFIDANIGIAVGDSGTILHTTDGGATWTSQSSGTLVTLRGVSSTDVNTGIAVGDSGTILRTTNGGAAWMIQMSGTTNRLMGISFIDVDTGTVVGDGGTILHTSTGGTAGVKDDPGYTTHIPDKCALKQNYPNPFNPSTNILFHVQSKTFVSLKVFDLLGREIATLVSGELSAGDHIQPWNAANISSGVYFYRLQAGAFIETKRLIVLR